MYETVLQRAETPAPFSESAETPALYSERNSRRSGVSEILKTSASINSIV